MRRKGWGEGGPQRHVDKGAALLAGASPPAQAMASEAPSSAPAAPPRQQTVLPVVPKSEVASDTSATALVTRTLTSGELWRSASSAQFWKEQCLGTAVVCSAVVSVAVYLHRTRFLPADTQARRMVRLKALDRSLLGSMTTLGIIYFTCPGRRLLN